MIKETKFSNVFELRRGKKHFLLTKNLVPGVSVYGERLVKDNDTEYREWNPNKSKLAAAILKGIHQVNLKQGSVVLYLGASTGTTVSHVSDIVGKEGFVFALDSAPRVVRELVFLCEERPNIAPILADANQPGAYKERVAGVEWLYQDISQKHQVDIFLKNADMFLKPGCFALLAVKARSIDVTKDPSVLFDEVKKKLEEKMKIVDKVLLAPFQKDHCLFVCKKG
ncbi:fibrillarin-like rRNA/tRNA 2'-O-methyltransferase [Candidatus Woesearchaeota archaeon]|nr:fibrillarin-like rRNA/tRNA 2'-O-methyltransferase [Candidatus Woesearchaeota archaeon]